MMFLLQFQHNTGRTSVSTTLQVTSIVREKGNLSDRMNCSHHQHSSTLDCNKHNTATTLKPQGY